MILSDQTLALLKACANINKSILIRPGKTLKTISPGETVLFSSEIEEEFTERVAIYDLSRFLNILSIFDNPVLDFGSTSVTIKANNQKIDYHYAAENMIIAAPEKDIKFPAPTVEIELSASDIESVKKATNILESTDVAIVAEDGKIYLKSLDSDNQGGDNFSIEIGDCDKEFKCFFKKENFLPILTNKYNVQISNKGIAKFESEKTTFVLAVEHNSSFGE